MLSLGMTVFGQVGLKPQFPEQSRWGCVLLPLATPHFNHRFPLGIERVYKHVLSMYSLTFRVHVTTPPQYRRNGTAHAADASTLSPARGVFADMRSVRVRHACGGSGGLPLGSATHFHSVATATQPVHRLQIRPIVHN